MKINVKMVHVLQRLIDISQNMSGFVRSLLNRTNFECRSFTLTRSFFAGSRKYAWTWCGDNSARWMDLRVSIANLIVSGLNGIAFTGADVGGFFGNVTAELLVRWYQVGAWCYPFFREYANVRSSYREPYLYNHTILRIIRHAIEDQYRMLPMWYTTVHVANLTGESITKPLWVEFPEIEIFHDFEGEILVANSLLVIPEITNSIQPSLIIK